MPRAARVCPVRGCIELVTGSARYCDEHERVRQRKQFNKRYKAGKVNDYGPEWAAIRNEYLEHHPYCVICGQRATDVDHIVSFKVSNSHDWSNLQSFCRSHHSQKTAKEEGGFGNRRQ